MEFNRSDTILKYIVEYFIKNAQPVGSHTLIEEYNLPYSSATIRNEMFALEKLGYIEKTHSSSGRVPSAKGYKYYCDHLRDDRVNEELKHSLQLVLDEKVKSVEQVIKTSCEILSHMTSLVSVVMGPDEESEKLANVQLIQISENTLTAVFVTDKGYVENKTFIVESGISPQEIVQCMNLLNDRLRGTPVSQLIEKTQALKPILSEYVISHDVVYQALMETFLRFASDRLSLYGRDELFNNPEFKNDADKLERVLKLLSDASLFKNAGKKLEKEEGNIAINIGEVEGNPDVTMVTTKFKVGSEGEQSLTLLGPTRMDYAKVISALEYFVDELNAYFTKNEKGGKTSE
ncbi:MAG: heat-inducible transcriptional repressor HrcA [Bacilli bacterium]|nr:heat-inducible transcriptional repressor HrcA [Bacilli bacterium]